MGLGGRRYMGGGGDRAEYGTGGLLGGLPRPSRVVGSVLILNLVVFVVQAFLDRPTRRWPAGAMSSWLGVTVAAYWQLWRYLTSQFLHAGFLHIVLNMLGVYLLGSPLERQWGGRRFLAFYLSCGAVGGVAYALIGSMFDLDPHIPIIGASGGVYAIVLACAVLFPHFQLILLFFPVPIRLAAIIIFGGMALLVTQSLAARNFASAASDVAHLGGAVAAACWIWAAPAIRFRLGASVARGGGRWKKKLARRQDREATIDRILEKIRREGIGSLSWWDKRRLRSATRQQKEEERQDQQRLKW